MLCRAAALALACGTLSAQALAAGGSEVPVVTKVAELPPAPAHQWTDLQANLNDNRIHGNGLVSMPALQKYLNDLYAKLKASAGVPDWPGSVYISADTTLNAHSSASGNLFLHIALIQSAETEDEIYSVLAHEFAHVYLNHQATYESHNTAENLRLAGTVVGMLAGKITGATTGAVKWGLGDTIGAADSLAHDALIPVWQREVEQQADMAGVNLSMRSNYSYPAGFKTFLERLATIEQREAAVAAAITAAEAAKAANKPGIMFVSADATPRRTHATAQEREAQLTELVAPLLPRPRIAPRKAPWQAALRDPNTAEILAHFALLPRIAQLQAAGKQGDALKLAQTAASGATAGDATMLLTLQEAMRRTGAPPINQALVLLSNKDWTERSWNAMRQGVYLGFLPAQPAMAKEMMTALFTTFGEPSAAMPDMVAFYLQTKDQFALTGMLARCLQYASYRKACGESSKTDQERAQEESKAKARTDQLGKNAADKVQKFFKWK
jgi:Zn-dependent protease with chaperone function